MKKMFQILFVALLGLSVTAFAHDGSHGEVSNAKAGELALHRIGKLVDLKKIDGSFIDKIYAVQVMTLPDGAAAGAVYKTVAFQAPAADGNRTQIEILLDGTGKALSHSVKMAGTSAAPNWPSKDPLTISENAFHYVLENSTDATVKPFSNGFSEMTLAAVAGQAKATFKSTQSAQVLVIYLNLDGVVTKAEVQ